MQFKNLRSEHRNERIEQMVSAVGWWKACIYDEESWIEPVAFFATIAYEEKKVWDGGQTGWEKCQSVYAQTCFNQEWFIDYVSAVSTDCYSERLFYDPNFKLSQEDQDAGHSWIERMKNYHAKRNAERLSKKEAD